MQSIRKLQKPVPFQPQQACKTDPICEPTELRQLKYKLAHLNCKCETCATRSLVCHQQYKHQRTVTSVQTDQTQCYSDKLIQVSPRNASTQTKTQSSQSGVIMSCEDNKACPTCLYAFSFLRNGVTKIYKDEESETVKGMSGCDKATSRYVSSVEKSTSMTSRLLAVSQDLSEYSSNSSETYYHSNSSSRVRFNLGGDPKEHWRRFQVHNVDVTYIENLINSIRPLVSF